MEHNTCSLFLWAALAHFFFSALRFLYQVAQLTVSRAWVGSLVVSFAQMAVASKWKDWRVVRWPPWIQHTPHYLRIMRETYPRYVRCVVIGEQRSFHYNTIDAYQDPSE